MSKVGAHRSLIALAMLRLSERDLRSFHELINELNASGFIEIVRDLEDEVENSISLVLDRTREQSYFNSEYNDLFQELDRLRKVELRISVQEFAHVMTKSITKNITNENSEVPAFDSRRGLQAWIKKLVKHFSETEVYHAAMRINYKKFEDKGSDWKLK